LRECKVAAIQRRLAAVLNEGIAETHRATVGLDSAAIVERRLDDRGVGAAGLAQHALIEHQFRGALPRNRIIALHVHQRPRQIDQFADGTRIAAAMKIQIAAAVKQLDCPRVGHYPV